MKNIVRKTLSSLIAISVLTLNFTGLLQCTSLTMSDDCCHISNKVKTCCVKTLKITMEDRISGYCGCTIQQTPQTVNLYYDMNNSNRTLVYRAVHYNTSIEAGYHPDLISKFTSEYSPPIKELKYSYLTNLSLRI